MSERRREFPFDYIDVTPVQPARVATQSDTFAGHPSRTPGGRRIVVSGASPTIVEALGAALTGQTGLEVLSTAMSESGLFEVVARRRPDAVLVYVPVLDSITIKVVDRLKMHDPALRIVMLAGRSSMQALAHAAEAGAAACLSLNASLRDLAEAIRADTTDTMLVDSTSLSAFTEARKLEVPERGSTALTRRELEVLTMMAEGCSPSVIAAKLVISIYTVRGHVESVLRKLGAHSQLEAVAMARNLRLVGSVPFSPEREELGQLRSIGPGYQGQLLGWHRNA